MKKRRTRWKKVRILAAKKQALRRKKEIFVTLIILHVVEMFCLQWKVHLVHQLQAPHSNNLKPAIQTEHKRIKNSTGRRQPWLLTSVAEDLNSGQLGGTQRQFSENICSEDDLRSRIFGTFVVKFLACLPLLGFSNI